MWRAYADIRIKWFSKRWVGKAWVFPEVLAKEWQVWWMKPRGTAGTRSLCIWPDLPSRTHSLSPCVWMCMLYSAVPFIGEPWWGLAPTLPKTHILQLLCSELHCCHLPKGNCICIASALSDSYSKCHPVASPLKQINVWFKMALEPREAGENRCIWIYQVWSGVSGTLKRFPKISDQCPRPSWQSVTQLEGEGPPHLEWSSWGVRWTGDARFLKFLKSFHSSNGF